MITVIKNDHTGREVWRYEGEVVERGPTFVLLEAHFNRDDRAFEYVTFRRGDRMLEWFYSDRWYNIFELHDVDDDRIKGWYCNITRPAYITDDTITSDDLALDLFIYPDGSDLLLDEEDFAALDLPAADRAAALAAIEALRERVADRRTPFDAIA